MPNKQEEKFNAIILPHTHWDREWYSTFQNFRSRLVAMMDNLLDILERDPAFTCFTFDGQVIPFEDYLEVRPERREDIRKHVKAERIAVGPYYVLPDNFLISGEAHIRNLLLGMRVSEEFGRVMKVGYIPDAFGQIAQTPQILQGFGIDSAVIFRGVGNEGDSLKSEFIWRASDQRSSVLTHWLVDGYGTLEKVSEDMKNALSQLDFAVKRSLVKASTRNVLLMNGMDHVEAQPHIPLVVREANQKSTNGKFKIGTLPEFFEAVRKDNPELSVYQGEFRGAKYSSVTPGVTSTRTYLKQKNVETETLLEKWVEPFDAWVWTLGGRHNHGLIWQAWKHTLQCHPHDSICGCGIDPVHEETMRRFTSAQQLGETVVKKDLSLIASNVNMKPDEYAIVVFNALAWSRTDIVEATILTSKSTEKFELVDSKGKPALFSVVDERTIGRSYSSRFKEKVFDIALLAENVPPCGYKTYKVRPIKEKQGKQKNKNEGDRQSNLVVQGSNAIENEFFRVQVEKNGSVTLLDKATGTSYEGFNTFEDVGDVGDEYNYDPPKQDKVYSSENLIVKITPCASGSAICTLKIEYDLVLPISASNDRKTRSSTLVSCPAACYVSLYPGVPRVDFRLELVNNAKDHRPRILFPTGIKCEHSYADQAFHVIERSVKLPDAKNWAEPPMPTYPMQSYVSAGDEKYGVTVATRGLHEYEVKKDGTIAITLLRCVGWLSRDDLTTRSAPAGPIIQTPDAQCLGRQTFFYSVIPHKGTWETGRAYVQAMEHGTPMRIVQVLDHEFAVLGEWALVYTEFKYPVVKSLPSLPSSPYPLERSYLSVEPSNVVLSAVKRAEDGSGIIVRFYNTTSQKVESKLTFHRKVVEAIPVNMHEKPSNDSDENKGTCHVRDQQITFEAHPFRVNTLKLKLG